jgi:hypothetical protein
MPEAIHDKFAKLADRLIKKHGRDFTLTKLSQISLDPTKDWRATKSPNTTVKVRGVFAADGFGRDVTKDTVGDAKRDLQTILVAALSSANLDPVSYDTITDGILIYRIENASILKPGTTTILYSFRVYR